MPKTVKILTIAVLLVVLVLAGAGYYFSGLVVSPKIWNYEESFRTEVEKGRIDRAAFDRLAREEVYIDSSRGYRLHALYFPVKGSLKTVAFAHGFTFTLMGSIKYIDIFLKRGFNVLAYDHRHHGKSGGENVTFGYYEKDDLKAWIDWVFSKTGKGTIVGIHGESMGAAVALQYAATDDRARFIIADSSFADLTDLLGYQLKKDFGLPSFPMVPVASLIARLRGGMFFGDVSPIKDIAKIQAPVMIIHGAEDTYVPVEMARRLFEAKMGKKQIYLGPGAGHSESFIKNRKDYDAKIGEFLGDAGL